MQRLDGKNAVVTGAAAGVGRAASLLFAREGAAVLCVDSHSEEGEATAAQIRREGGNASFVATDLCDPASIDRMADDCLAWCGDIHVLFNAATDPATGRFERLSLDVWNQQLAINLTAPFLCSQKLLPGFRAAGGGSIVHHGSIDGVLGNPNLVAYSTAKGGLIALTHVMAHWLGREGIRVNCLNTAALRASKTGIALTVEHPTRDFSEAQRAATPLGRAAYLEEAAQAALFLASDASSYVNGSVITVDGGRSVITPGTF